MSENQPQPEHNPQGIEGESERSIALDAVFASVYCAARVRQVDDMYNRNTIDSAASRYFDAAHIESRPSSVAVWADQENESAVVLAAVVSHAMFSAESVLPDEERLFALQRSQDALYKMELIENRSGVGHFFDLIDRNAREMLNAYSVDSSVSQAEYKRLFGLYKQLYVTKYMTSTEASYPRTPRLSFWAHIAEGALMRVLTPIRKGVTLSELPAPTGEKRGGQPVDEQAEHQKWMDRMHPNANDDPDNPDDGARV